MVAADDVFPLDEAQIIAVWMGAVCFGILLISSFICIHSLLSSKSALGPITFRVLLGVSILMTILIGLDTSLQLRHTLDAFVYYKGPGGPPEFLNDRRNWLTFVETAIYTVQTRLGDGVMVYRSYIVFDRRWYGIVPPLILYVSILATGSLPLYFTAVEGQGTITGAKIGPAILSFSLLSLAQNIGITVAIALRIYLMQRRMACLAASDQTLDRIKRAVIIIIESGAIYSASMLLFVGSLVSNNVTDYGWSTVIGSVIPIALNLIIIRVHQGRAVGNQTTASKSKPGEFSTIIFRGRDAPTSGARVLGRGQSQGANTTDAEPELVNTDSELSVENRTMGVSISATNPSESPIQFDIDLKAEVCGEK